MLTRKKKSPLFNIKPSFEFTPDTFIQISGPRLLQVRTVHSPAEPALAAQCTVPPLLSFGWINLSPASLRSTCRSSGLSKSDLDQRGCFPEDLNQLSLLFWTIFGPSSEFGVRFGQVFISGRVAGSLFKSAWLSELSFGTDSPLYRQAMIPGERKQEGGRESHSSCCVVHPFLYLFFWSKCDIMCLQKTRHFSKWGHPTHSIDVLFFWCGPSQHTFPFSSSSFTYVHADNVSTRGPDAAHVTVT